MGLRKQLERKIKNITSYDYKQMFTNELNWKMIIFEDYVMFSIGCLSFLQAHLKNACVVMVKLSFSLHLKTFKSTINSFQCQLHFKVHVNIMFWAV